ncbi:MAG TPA: hypothetical protein VK837_04495 [Longimicrobiales bacterium]|nr:hypothetical protein [Longimicrobiales bacterium]
MSAVSAGGTVRTVSAVSAVSAGGAVSTLSAGGAASLRFEPGMDDGYSAAEAMTEA